VLFRSGGSSTVHMYTQTVQGMSQNKQYIEQHKKHKTTQKLGRVRAVPRLCGFYPGKCQGKNRLFLSCKANASQLRRKHGKPSVRVAIHKHTIKIHSHNNKNT
jgi:archaeosine-15-forming tRNA-guanine transglycosylase